MVRSVVFVALVALACEPALGFVNMPLHTNSFARLGGAGASCAAVRRGLHASSSRPARNLGLRMAEGETEEKKKAEEPVSTLSDEDLDARIASLGLGTSEPLEDRSTGEEEEQRQNDMTSIEKVQEQSAELGKAAIRAAAGGAISLLNQIEQPIDEEDWKKKQEEQKKQKKLEAKKAENSMIDAGALVVVVPIVLVGGALAAWSIASELALF